MPFLGKNTIALKSLGKIRINLILINFDQSLSDVFVCVCGSSNFKEDVLILEALHKQFHVEFK